MGKTKIKTIDDSKPEEVASGKSQESRKTENKTKPKDKLAASLLEELNQEFGEVEEKKESQPKAGRPLDEKVPKKQEKKQATSIKKPETRKRGKKYQEASAQVEKDKRYPLDEALDLVKKTSFTKFEGSVEAHINTNVKNIRGLISLPFVSGKKLNILAFGKGADKSGADIVGTDEIISEIEKGKINFDVLVTTPEWMPKLAKVAKVLGPRGLMPNPKNGTITDDLEKAIKELQSGKVEYKTEKDGQVIHLLIGKVSQEKQEIASNIKTLYSIIGKSKIKKITLSPTMGPGVKVDLTSI